MARDIRVEDVLEHLSKRLKLTLAAGNDGLQRSILNDQLEPGSYTIAGPLNYIHPNQIQVLGEAEYQYLADTDRNRPLALEKLFKSHTRMVLLVDDIKLDEDIRFWADETGITLCTSPLPSHSILDHLQQYASVNFAEQTNLHGVFLEVFGMGILLTGDPAVGKSELALELISRGHRLIADDAPLFSRTAPDTISGECPIMLREFLEVRGLGVLNVRAMFGDSAVKRTKILRLILHLQPMKKQQIASMDRLSPDDEVREVLGVSIPQFTIPVAPGRNLGIIVEAAVRNHVLKLKGYNATEVFIQRQQQALLSPE